MPLHVLIENGYRDIIGIRLQGMGIERKVGIPEGVNVSIIEPRVKLGSSLGFDAEKSAYHIQMGYLDAQKLLYGLYGEGYYIDRTLTERRAYRLLAGAAVSYFRDMGTTVSLREINERIVPRLVKNADSDADYYGLLVRTIEDAAIEAGIEREKIYTDVELIELLKAEGGKYALIPQIAKLYKEYKK